MKFDCKFVVSVILITFFFLIHMQGNLAYSNLLCLAHKRLLHAKLSSTTCQAQEMTTPDIP